MALFNIIQDIDESLQIKCHSYELIESCREQLLHTDYNFKILTFNIRSYQRNFDNFYSILQRLDCELDVIVLTECWLSDGLLLELLPGYTGSRTYLQSNKNGGVVVYTKSSWNFTVSEPTIADADSLLIKINSDIAILGIYRSPSYTNPDNFTTSLDATLNQLNNYDKIFVTGDINIDICNEINNKNADYLRMLATHGLLPAITMPTRNNTCLDHIFIKSRNKSTGVISKCSVTDHDIAMAATCLKNNKSCSIRTKWKIKIDEEAVVAELNSISWNEVLNQHCTNSAVNIFIEIITTSLKKHSRKVRVSRSNYNIKPWITPGLIRCMRHRDKLHLASRVHQDDQMKRLIYTRYRNFCNRLLHKLKTNYHSNLIENSQADSKKLWKTIKSIYSNNQKTLNDSDKLVSHTDKNPTESLDKCNTYFTTLGNKLSDLILSRLSETQASLANKYTPNTTCPHTFFLHPTDESEIASLITQLNNDSAPGPDNLNVRLIKKIKTAIIQPLTVIFNLSLESGIFPDRWKVAAVSPIHKSGATDIPDNYRPIALLPILSKLLEKVVNKRLTNFFEKHNIISNKQFGFRRGRSTEDAARLLTNIVSSTVDKGERTMCAFLDLAKAFDTISIDLLLKKLEAAGIRGTPLNWLKSYLSNRKQFVKLGDISSSLLPINYGIPQGSTLGPTLFLLYVNDILNISLTSAEIIAYADDTVVIFHGKNWDQVYSIAEVGLLTIANALDRNLLTLNVKKTKIITFYKTMSSRPPQHLTLTFHSCSHNHNSRTAGCSCTVIERIQSMKYLGITLDENLSFKPQIHALSSRVRKLIYIMKKLRDCTPPPILRTVYFGLCQSVLQYGISVWGGAGKATFIEAERAQRAVIKVMLKKPLLYSTDNLYKDFPVLRVRQLFILNAVLQTHKKLKSRPDYTEIISKRTFRIPIPQANSLMARRSPNYLYPRIYNEAVMNCDIIDLKISLCKKIIKNWLLTLSYDETEGIIYK